MSNWRDLHEGWTLHSLSEGEIPDPVLARTRNGIPANVPGCVHTDLLAADLIPDPYLDLNENELRWIGRSAWEYRTTFEWHPGVGNQVDLVCDGLDTVATVRLNGIEVASTQNMHRSYRWPVQELLHAGANELTVTFASPERYAAEQKERLGNLPGPNSATPEPFNFIRKMACNFGWDWGPVLVTSGIWKPIRLHSWRTARLATVRPRVGMAGENGQVRIDVELEHAGGGEPLSVVARVAGEQVRVDNVVGSTTVELTVPRPEVWWPHTMGAQPLYELEVELVSDGSRLDGWSRRVGFRTVRLDTEADQAGSAFTLVINDTPIFAKGANWIPDDCFPSRVDAARYRRRLTQTLDANIDLLRVWGGGLYEQDEFYQACDELGILVWQDFPFACAAYPEEEPFASEVEAEARENVRRLMPHPSLVIWNGNNENIWGSMEWGWDDRIADRTWGKGYYLDLLPRVVAEVDPTRPYWPGSPYSGTFDVPVNADGYGCSHIWDVWNQRDYPIYRSYVPRFVSEFGWQGPPTWSTLTRAIHDEPLAPDSPGVLHHQKASGGNDKLLRGLQPHFEIPESFEDWHWAMQLNQARAIRFALEHWRSHRGRCMGTVVWQLNDCWPVTSWAAVDGDGRPKPLWYALKQAYESRLVTVQPRGSAGLHVIAVNDEREPWQQDVVVRRLSFDGTELARHEESIAVGTGTEALRIPDPVATPADPRSEMLMVTVGDRRTVWFFEEDKRLNYPRPAYRVSTDRAELTITAETLLRDLSVLADRIDPAAEVDDMLITLLPGESHTFRLRGLDAVPQELGPSVIRTAADLA